MQFLFWASYQVAMGLLLLTAGPFLLLSRGSHYRSVVPGRLGSSSAEDGSFGENQGGLWVHAVSVGEVGVAATLVRALPAALPLLVTTVTPTGQARARSAFAKRAAVAYLPFELGFAVRRFFTRFSPRALVLVEGDLWPLVLREARCRKLPIVVVNGRVSDRSFRRMRRFRPFLSPLLSGIDRFGVQTGEDREKLLRLGVPAELVTVTGNLKYESPEPERKPELEREIARLAAGRPLLLAGSTMAGEEEAVLDAFLRLGGGERALLLLAPRHPERWDEVDRLLASRGVAALRRSRITPLLSSPHPHPPPRPGGRDAVGGSDELPAMADAVGSSSESSPVADTVGSSSKSSPVSEEHPTLPQPSNPSSEGSLPPGRGGGRGWGEDRRGVASGELPAILLLDSLGELAGLYSQAAAAFVGGTLVPTGGHNPLEPARFGVATAVGPSMDNFRDMAERFDEASAWSRVKDAASLADVWNTWLTDPAAARAVGENAKKLVEANRGALAATLELLRPALALFEPGKERTA